MTLPASSSLNLVRDVVPLNVPPKSGISTYLSDTLPKDHQSVIARIKKLEDELAAARALRTYIEAVAAAAMVPLPPAPLSDEQAPGPTA